LAENVAIKFKCINSLEFEINVSMPIDYYLALSFGGSHINSDMVVF